MKPDANVLFRIIAKLRSRLINPRIKLDKKIPIIINNFNRLYYLKKMLQWLEKAGYKNIYIIDNASTYQPLLEFYRKTEYNIFKLDKNVGHLALWQSHVFLYFRNTYYVYTDPDILPVENCPDDILNHFKNVLEQYPKISKVGFGLKIDDIPDYFPLKEKVLAWENMFWEKEIEKDVFDAKIDTTFALYLPNSKGDHTLPALRTGGNYIARHLSWYVDFEYLSNEDIQYYKTATNASSWVQESKKSNSRY